MRRPIRHRPLTALGVALGALALGAASGAPKPLAHAVAEQRQLAEAAPADARAWNDLGNLLALAGEPAAAEGAYQSALAADPGNAAAHYNLGRLLLDLGRHREARRALRRAVELEPANAAAHFFLGAVYDAQGRSRPARRAYLRAFALEPQLADPARNPHLAGSRQALAAQVVTWLAESPADPGAQIAWTRTPAVVADAETASNATPVSPPADERGPGGVVRSVSGAPPPSTKNGEPPRAEPFEPSHDKSSHDKTAGDTRAPSSGSSRRGVVLAPGDLRSGTVVNQVSATDAGGGNPDGVRAAPGRGGRNSRFVPPPRPSPFTPFTDSTGRLETTLEPVSEAAPAVS